MPRRILLPAILAILMVPGLACGPFRIGGPTEAVILFHNQSIDQANVYALLGSQTLRIGTVFGGRTDTLRVPGTGTEAGVTVSIIARFLASNRQVSTGQLTMGTGDTLSVTLSSDQKILSVLPPRQ